MDTFWPTRGGDDGLIVTCLTGTAPARPLTFAHALPRFNICHDQVELSVDAETRLLHGQALSGENSCCLDHFARTLLLSGP